MTGPSATPGRFEVEAERWAEYRQNSRGQWRVWWIGLYAGEGLGSKGTSFNIMSRVERAEHAWAREIAEAHMPEGRVK